MAKVKTKKQNDTNDRVWSGYDVQMYSQWVNIPLQVLNRHVLTVGAISGFHFQIRGTILPAMKLHDQQKTL